MLTAQTNLPATDIAASVTMSSLRETSRPILVFSPTDFDPRLLMQMRLFAGGPVNLRERQVILVPVSLRHKAGASEMLFKEGSVHVTPQEVLTLRKKLHISPEEFTVVLLGKDGSEKFRSHAPVTIEKLDTLIDAMPMRQQEVRNGHSK